MRCSSNSHIRRVEVNGGRLTVIDISTTLMPLLLGGHGGRVVTLLPPTSEIGVRFPARPQVGKLLVACRWPAVYRTEP